MNANRKDHGVEAPVSLMGLFGGDSDGEEGADSFENLEEIQEIDLAGTTLAIRQCAWHQTNANKVWPGSFVLSEKLLENKSLYSSGLVLELGTATGALAIFMRKHGFDVITSDIDDGGDVEEMVHFNTTSNGLEKGPHIPHTWGEQWQTPNGTAPSCKFVVASDILLYYNVYDKLVQTLQELFEAGAEEFLMAWNRRMAASVTFFEMMTAAGFDCKHHGKCVYSFYMKAKGSSSLPQPSQQQLLNEEPSGETVFNTAGTAAAAATVASAATNK